MSGDRQMRKIRGGVAVGEDFRIAAFGDQCAQASRLLRSAPVRSRQSAVEPISIPGHARGDHLIEPQLEFPPLVVQLDQLRSMGLWDEMLT